MAKKFGCLKFPFEEDTLNQSLKHTTTINDTLESSIKCFILTKPGQRRGNRIGCFLTEVKHQLFSDSVLRESEEKLKQELSLQFPQINFLLVVLVREITDNVSGLRVRIGFSTNFSDVTELSFII